jgi:GAF domain-containing protein
MFERLLATAAALCRADHGNLYQHGQGASVLVASYNAPAHITARNRELLRSNVTGINVVRPDEIPKEARTLIRARVLLAGGTLHVPDIQLDPDFARNPAYAELGVRAALGVLMKRGDEIHGLITLTKRAAGPFDESAIKLVQAFADQAVIAIENVRLFNETKDALERQTATAEVLKTISRSAFDLQAVLDTVVENASTLCAADAAWITFRSAEPWRLMAFSSGVPVEQREAAFERMRQQQAYVGIMQRLYAEATTIHVADVETDPELHAASFMVHDLGGRTVLAVPVLREGQPVAGIVFTRRQVRPFSDREIELAETFADQAGITIENVRLFNETKEALERQTATGEVLKVISRSTSDLRPVFDIVVEYAARLCRADAAWMNRIDESGAQTQVANFASAPDLAARIPTMPPGSRNNTSSVMGRAVVDRRPVHVVDVQARRCARTVGSKSRSVYGWVPPGRTATSSSRAPSARRSMAGTCSQTPTTRCSLGSACRGFRSTTCGTRPRRCCSRPARTQRSSPSDSVTPRQRSRSTSTATSPRRCNATPRPRWIASSGPDSPRVATSVATNAIARPEELSESGDLLGLS